MDKIQELLASLDREMDQIDRQITELTELIPAAKERERFDSVRARQSALSDRLLEQKVRLLEFLCHLAVSLDIKQVILHDHFVNNIQLDMFGGELKIKCTDYDVYSISNFHSVKDTVALTRFFPFNGAFEHFLRTIGEKLEANNTALRHDVSLVTRNCNLIIEAAKKIKNKVSAA